MDVLFPHIVAPEKEHEGK